MYIYIYIHIYILHQKHLLWFDAAVNMSLILVDKNTLRAQCNIK